jgi:GT2 family glycosyltransferase
VKLSVVVGTLNRRDQLRACVESVFAETSTGLRLYVTDAGSTDGTIEYLESVASDRLVPVLEGRRRGQAVAYNRVFASVETPYVCWLSDDNVVVNRGLDTAVRILDDHAGIGMVALKVSDVKGPFVAAPYIGGVSAIGILNVNQGVLRTALLNELGGFSEAFQDYGIDPDLTARVLFSGHSVVYTREVAIHHYRNWSPDTSSEEHARKMERQRVYLDLYRRKYAGCSRGGFAWRIKSAFWRCLQAALGAKVSLESTQRFLGLIPRDWRNVLMSRYVSVLDPLVSHGKPYYLVQYCPPRLRPKSLPADPAPPLAAAAGSSARLR